MHSCSRKVMFTLFCPFHDFNQRNEFLASPLCALKWLRGWCYCCLFMMFTGWWVTRTACAYACRFQWVSWVTLLKRSAHGDCFFADLPWTCFVCWPVLNFVMARIFFFHTWHAFTTTCKINDIKFQGFPIFCSKNLRKVVFKNLFICKASSSCLVLFFTLSSSY